MFDDWHDRLADARQASGESGNLTLVYVYAPG